jgi:ketosteroid isomerase-like protein
MMRPLQPARLWQTAAVVLFALSPPALWGLPQSVPAAPVPAPSPHGHREHKRDYKREIEGIEDQWRQAVITADEPTLDRLLAPDYLGITMTGQVNDKTQELDRMRDRDLVLKHLDLSEKKIKLVGSVAIVTSLAKVEGTNHGTPIKGMFRYTRIYRRYSDGSWKITNFEVTPIYRGSPDQS